MPPQEFDPDEFTTPDFDPSEFEQPQPSPRADFTSQVLASESDPSLWERINTPLIDVSPYGRAASEYITTPTLEDSESYWLPRIKGFIGGAAEGASNVLSGMTSPLGIAGTALGFGSAKAAAAGLPRVAQAARAGLGAVSGAGMVHGGGEVYQGLSEGDINRALAGVGEVAGSAAAPLAGTALGKVRIGRAKTKIPVETPRGIVNITNDIDFVKQVLPEESIGTEVVAPEPPPPSVEAQAFTRPEEAPRATGDPEIDAILQKFEQGGMPKVEVVDNAGNVINASGESAASAEALSRQASMKAKGEQYVVYDQAGNMRPLIGPEAVDYTPGRGETYGIQKSDGTFIKLEDRGGKVTATRQVSPRKREYPGFKGEEKSAEPLRQRLERATEPKTPAEAPDEISNLAKEVEAAKDAPDVIEEERRDLVRRALDFNKSLLTSWDLSAPGRQGKAFILNKAWWTSLDDMVKAWGSEKAANTIHQSIIDHPSGYFKPRVDAAGRRVPSLAERVKLDLADAEEVFKSSAIGQSVRKYMGITKSSRAHTAFLNKLRSDQFVSMMDKAKKAGLDPENNIVLAKAYADFINSATGRGSLNVGNWKLGRVTGVLNDVFFAPKNLSGQIRTWNNVLNPVRYAQYDDVMRKQALRSLFAIAGTGVGVTSLASMGGAKTSTDPSNTDFMKIVVGDTRIDPFGGYQQFPVAAARLLLGQTTNPVTGKTTDLTAGRFGQSTRRSVAERFFVNRLAPLPSFIWAWMDNRDFDGKPFEWKKAAFDRVFPIAAQDIIELAQEEPELASILAVPTTLGLTGTQTYTRE